MAMNFTPDQQRVIDTRNCNILVSAAAGSGKTAVLVERIIQMITDDSHPVDIDRLLIVTFTNAAAAEMRPDFLAKRKSRGEKTTRTWSTQSWMKSTTAWGSAPSLAILAP